MAMAIGSGEHRDSWVSMSSSGSQLTCHVRKPGAHCQFRIHGKLTGRTKGPLYSTHCTTLLKDMVNARAAINRGISPEKSSEVRGRRWGWMSGEELLIMLSKLSIEGGSRMFPDNVDYRRVPWSSQPSQQTMCIKSTNGVTPGPTHFG